MTSETLHRHRHGSLRLTPCVVAILAAVSPAGAATASTAASTIPVTSCADDDGFDTLRHAVLVANPGDTVDLSGLSCSKITLQSGAIAVGAADLTIAGPGSARLAIDGAKADRVFKHTGLGTLTLNNLTVSGGRTTADAAYGGCIYSKGSVALNGSTVTGCEAVGQTKAAGGAIVAFAKVIAKNSELSANKATVAIGVDGTFVAAGGAVFATEKLQLYHTAMSGNIVQSPLGKTYGGGSFSGALSVKYSTISGNQALAAGDAVTKNYSVGGASIASADVQIVASTIDHNTADVAGAFDFLSGDGTVQISRSTISSNTGTLGVGGMAVNADISIYNSTIAFNVSGPIAPFSNQFNYAVVMQSTVIADNPPLDLVANAVTGANNLIKNAYSGTILPMDTITLDPQLGPLLFNGGTTRTHALAANSPARDSGANPANVPYDQRGPAYQRAVGTPDIGAVEYDADHIFGDGVDLK